MNTYILISIVVFSLVLIVYFYSEWKYRTTDWDNCNYCETCDKYIYEINVLDDRCETCGGDTLHARYRLLDGTLTTKLL